MTHDEFLRRYSNSLRYADLWLGGWRPEEPLPERWWWFGNVGVGGKRRARLWFMPKDVVWGMRRRLPYGVRVQLVEMLEQFEEEQGVVADRLWARELVFRSRNELGWVCRYCLSEPVPRGWEKLWSMPRYVLPELVERIDDRAFWGYVFWLVMRGHPYCFDDVRVSRMFDLGDGEAARERELMLDMGWFVPSKFDSRRHWWVREPKGVALG